MGWIKDKLSKGEYFSCKDLYDKFNFKHVMGVAVTGINAIAGPITLSSVVLPHDYNETLDLKPFSNASSKKNYDDIYNKIRKQAININFGWASPVTISLIGKHKAMEAAFGVVTAIASKYNPMSVIIVDKFKSGLMFANLEFEGSPVIYAKGSTRCLDTSIAAYISAQKARQGMIVSLCHSIYPEYGWDSNFGYATKQHIEAIKEFGISPFHRNLNNIKTLDTRTLKINIKDINI